MKLTFKIFIYESSNWVDYTSYMQKPWKDNNSLDEVLSESVVNLFSLDKEAPFTPSTPIKLEIYDDSVLKKTVERMVENDSNEKITLYENSKWNHKITMIELASISQKYIVDNMGATYQLEDVDLNYDFESEPLSVSSIEGYDTYSNREIILEKHETLNGYIFDDPNYLDLRNIYNTGEYFYFRDLAESPLVKFKGYTMDYGCGTKWNPFSSCYLGYSVNVLSKAIKGNILKRESGEYIEIPHITPGDNTYIIDGRRNVNFVSTDRYDITATPDNVDGDFILENATGNFRKIKTSTGPWFVQSLKAIPDTVGYTHFLYGASDFYEVESDNRFTYDETGFVLSTTGDYIKLNNTYIKFVNYELYRLEDIEWISDNANLNGNYRLTLDGYIRILTPGLITPINRYTLSVFALSTGDYVHNSDTTSDYLKIVFPDDITSDTTYENVETGDARIEGIKAKFNITPFINLDLNLNRNINGTGTLPVLPIAIELKSNNKYTITYNSGDRFYDKDLDPYTETNDLSPFFINRVAVPVFQDIETYLTTDFKELDFSFDFDCSDEFNISYSKSIIKKSNPFSLKKLLDQALLKTNVYKLGESFFIELDSSFEDILEMKKVNETIFQGKNLWEILVIIGQYIHGIPYLEFDPSNINKRILKFRYISVSNVNDTKVGSNLSIFNSRDIGEYVSTLESEVSNFINSETIITEIISLKTNDESFLVTNDNGSYFTERPIYGVKSLEIRSKLSENSWHDITNYIFEEGVYNILFNDDKATPNKGYSIKYKLGSNEINGLQYKLPDPVSSGDQRYAMKNIIGAAYGYTSSYNVKINDYQLRITYRTFESIRLKQFKPSISDYLKTSNLDQYPSFNQFFNQQEKLIDSDAYGQNMIGTLLRTGNTTYKRIETYTDYNNVKEIGEMYLIDDTRYFVSNILYEYFENIVIAEVGYSENFNRLSPIISYSVEQRFFSISEQSNVKRNVSMNEFCYFSLTDESTTTEATTIGKEQFFNILSREEIKHPQYAIIKFKGGTIDEDSTKWAAKADHDIRIIKNVIPLSSGNSLIYGCSMIDNYSAGNTIDNVNEVSPPDNVVDGAYVPMVPVRYSDIYGESDLFDFYLMNVEDIDTGYDAVKQFPLVSESTLTTNSLLSSEDNILLKDNRETIAISWQLNLINKGSFIIGTNVFKKIDIGDFKCYLLPYEVSNLTEVNVTGLSYYSIGYSTNTGKFVFDSSNLSCIVPPTPDYTNVQSIALIADSGQLLIARNVNGLTNAEKKANWYLNYTRRI